MCLNGLQHYPEKIVPVGSHPDRERIAPIWTQDPIGLCDRLVGVGAVEKAEGADDRVKARRIEPEVFGIALAKFDPRVAALRLGDHVRRKIDADRVRAACGGAVGSVAWSAGHIEDAHASANAGGIKQWRDSADRDLAG